MCLPTMKIKTKTREKPVKRVIIGGILDQAEYEMQFKYINCLILIEILACVHTHIKCAYSLIQIRNRQATGL